MTVTTARSQGYANNNDNGGIIAMKTKQELLQMLYSRLAEIQDGRIRKANPEMYDKLRTELALLYDILGDDIPEEYWEQIEEILYDDKSI